MLRKGLLTTFKAFRAPKTCSPSQGIFNVWSLIDKKKLALIQECQSGFMIAVPLIIGNLVVLNP